jgi:hypothetical protein
MLITHAHCLSMSMVGNVAPCSRNCRRYFGIKVARKHHQKRLLQRYQVRLSNGLTEFIFTAEIVHGHSLFTSAFATESLNNGNAAFNQTTQLHSRDRNVRTTYFYFGDIRERKDCLCVIIWLFKL